MSREFRVGDKVRAFGWNGVVEQIELNDRYPVRVNLTDISRKETFDLGGKYAIWHKEPSLELIERPNKKAKIEFYRRIEPNGRLTNYFYSDCGFTYSPAFEGGYENKRSGTFRGLEKYGEPIVLEVEE